MLGQMMRRITTTVVVALALLATAPAGAAPAGTSFDGTDGPAVMELDWLDRARGWVASLWAAATGATGGAEPEPTDNGDDSGSGTPLPDGAGDSGCGDHGAVVDPDG